MSKLKTRFFRGSSRVYCDTHTHASLCLCVFKPNTYWVKEGKLNCFYVANDQKPSSEGIKRKCCVKKIFTASNVSFSATITLDGLILLYATQPSLCLGCNLSAYLVSHRSRRSILSFPSRTVKQLTHPWSQPSELKNPVILLATSVSLIK